MGTLYAGVAELQVQNLVPVKICCVEDMKGVKSEKAQSSPVCVVGKFGEGVASLGAIPRSIANIPRVAFKVTKMQSNQY
ncbi:hypothetical protein TNCV_4660771 [Trichonephila clavipes]|uniref:Uncharacterized protein n=1 Tax=Trichonephila clavipes TaxID=2585209 RepID=A0A8X6VK32_TRICX|nr:hypothetical protein TNCV_4660771 [Trichonephila clavipes]